jgi:signal peptide peptidase SppA
MLVKYSRILQAVYSAVWAIQPEKLDQIVAFLEFASAGGKYSAEEVAERIGIRAEAKPQPNPQATSIAVIPIRGIISHRVSMMDSISGGGGTSVEQVTKSLRTALADETVKAILFDVDSPGGSVYGVDELAAEIMKSRGRKPMVAQVNALAASAAYYLASAADEIAMTPSGEAGSIGVLLRHLDQSKAAEMEGVKVTYIQAGEFKTEANPFEPLSDEAKAYLQKRVDEYYSMFVKSVAKGRNLPVATVRNDFGKGRTMGAEDALRVGMVDRIATYDETLSRLAGRRGATVTQVGARAEEERLAAEQLADMEAKALAGGYLQIAIDGPPDGAENPAPVNPVKVSRLSERRHVEILGS